MTRYPGLWITEFSAIGVVLAMVWNMTTKAGTGSAVAAGLVGYAAGAALGLYFSRAPVAATTAAVPTANS
jgi:hypothetical protein